MFGKLLFFFVFPKLGISYKVKKVPIHQGHRLLLPAPRIMRTYHLCFLNLSWNAPQPAFHIRRWYP